MHFDTISECPPKKFHLAFVYLLAVTHMEQSLYYTYIARQTNEQNQLIT